MNVNETGEIKTNSAFVEQADSGLKILIRHIVQLRRFK
jgi:hypothetical protein